MSDTLLALGGELSRLLTERFVDNDGLVVRQVDVEFGEMVDRRCLFDELGDYAQYVLLFGRLDGSDPHRTWALRQAVGGFHHCRSKDGIPNPLGKRGYIPILRLGDAVWGIAELRRLIQDPSLDQLAEAVINPHTNRWAWQSTPSYAVVGSGVSHHPLPLAEPMSAGYAAEACFALHDCGAGSLWLERALAILQTWLHQPTFWHHGTWGRICLGGKAGLPAYLLDRLFRLRGRPGMTSSLLTKGDVYLGFSMLSAWRATHEAIYGVITDRLRQAIAKHHRTPDGRFWNHYDYRRKKVSSIALEENHPVIEFCLDHAFDRGDGISLDLAGDALRAWWSRLTNNGLANRDGDSHLELDPQVDVAIDAIRYGQLSDDDAWINRGLDLIQHTARMHRARFGLHQKVEPETGTGSPTCETKFLGLFLKGILIAHHVQRGRIIHLDHDLRLLASDR